METITIAVLSGVQDGHLFHLNSEDDGLYEGNQWTISIGRREDNDLILRTDTFISRQHALLRLGDAVWILEDCDSTNGTFLENDKDFLSDTRVTSETVLTLDQLFRVGRTWLRLQASE